ncbi:MFS general substrate transporter [Colletotrichum asianum]
MSIFSLCVLGTPNEVHRLHVTKEERARPLLDSSATRLVQKKDSKIGDGIKPKTYIFFLKVIINSLPNRGTASFGNLIYVSFGFTPLETLVKGTIPQNVVPIIWFLLVGFATIEKQNARFMLMLVSTIPAFVGMLGSRPMPKDGLLWT